MDLNQVIYTVFHAEFESGSKIGPKPTQDPIFKNFDFYVFYKFNIIFFLFFNFLNKKPRKNKEKQG